VNGLLPDPVIDRRSAPISHEGAPAPPSRFLSASPRPCADRPGTAGRGVSTQTRTMHEAVRGLISTVIRWSMFWSRALLLVRSGQPVREDAEMDDTVWTDLVWPTPTTR
jgi:hypothetical protein